jgi:nucleoid DNA-binding protein
MKINELIEAIAKEKPRLLAGLPEKRSATIIRTALACIGRVIDATEEGRVLIGGLGVFNVRQVEREIDGRKVMKKIVVFRPVAPRKKDAV